MSRIAVVALAALYFSVDFLAAQESPAIYQMLAPKDDATVGPISGAVSVIPQEQTGTGRIWANADMLLWWVKGAPTAVPLISANPNPGAIAALNETGTMFLFGAGSNENINFGMTSGVRATIGGWIDANYLFGWEASGLVTERRVTNFSANTAGGAFPVIAIPFNATVPFGAEPAGETSLNSNGAPSTATVDSTMRLWSLEVNGLIDLWSSDRFYLTSLLGFRYIDLAENLTLSYTTFDTATAGTVVISDNFGTHNQFYATQVGTRVGVNVGKWNVELTGKFAIGTMHQTTLITGAATVANGAFALANGTTPGGLFAEPSNIGRHSRNIIAMAPEGQFKVAYAVSPYIRVFAGYSFLTINNVLRPGNQIDRNINPTQNTFFLPPGTLAGAAAPLPSARSSEFWAQGVSFGVEVRY